MSYQELPNTTTILRLADNASIPDDPKNRDRIEYLAWRALGNLPAAYVPPPETDEARQAKKDATLKLIDAASTRAIRELVLDQAGVISLTDIERAASRDRLKRENDKANSERAK